MKKISYVLLALTALFVNSTVYGVEARISATSVTQALQNAKSKNDFSALKSTKFDVKNKVYMITYLTKDGDIETLKISKINGKEVK
jgi:hypothetical protein